MRRILSLVVVALVMAAMMLAMAMPAFAAKGGIANDDKNNPTYPGTGAGHNPHPSEQAAANTGENCVKHEAKGAQPGQGLPAQCY